MTKAWIHFQRSSHGKFGLALEIRRSWSKLDLTTEDACLSSLKHGGLFVTDTLSLDICPAVKWIWEKFFSNHSEQFPALVLVWVCSYLLLLVSLSSFFPSSFSPYHPANHSSSLPLPEHSCFIYCKGSFSSPDLPSAAHNRSSDWWDFSLIFLGWYIKHLDMAAVNLCYISIVEIGVGVAEAVDTQTV